MACSNFPNTPTEGMKHQVGNVTYEYMAGVWEAITPSVDLELLGGDATLAQHPNTQTKAMPGEPLINSSISKPE